MPVFLNPFGIGSLGTLALRTGGP